MKQYQCRACGLPKKGHICLGRKQEESPAKRSKTPASSSASSAIEAANTFLDSSAPTDIATLLKDHLESVKAAFENRVKELQPPSGSEPKPQASPHAYDMLVTEVTKQYVDAIAKEQKKYAVDSATAALEHSAAVATHQASMATGGTTRTVEFEISPGTWQAAGSSSQAILLALFDETDSSKWTITFTSHGHDYKAVKNSGSVVQENTKFGTKRSLRVQDVPTAAKSSSPPPDPPSVTPWQNRIYYETWPVVLTNDFYTDILTQFSYDLTTDMINGQNISYQSASIAKLATLFDSFGLGQTFSPAKTELWANPPLMATFLRMARNRNYNELRVVMHGSGSYTAMRADPYLFDTTVLTASRRGHGIYVSCSPHIAYEYHTAKSSKAADVQAGIKYPNGTVLIGLLLRQKDSTKKNPSCDSTHTYEQYHLGSNNSTEVPGKDAFVVRDTGHLLWLGLCVP